MSDPLRMRLHERMVVAQKLDELFVKLQKDLWVEIMKADLATLGSRTDNLFARVRTEIQNILEVK